MDLDAARRFVGENHNAVLATRRRDGSPQLSPVLGALDARGAIVISTRETAVKTKNIRRQADVSLCVINANFYGQWIQADGTAEILSLPDAMEPLVEYYRSVAGEHPDWDEYRDAMRREKRCLIRITLTRAGPDTSG
jgi:PPOX class probable F420-dependent enzyme